jgi:RsiW-degrading membrane proteinase PrsW (M82 family)
MTGPMSQATRIVPLPTQGRQRRGVLAPVLGLVGLGICGLLVIWLLGRSVGVPGALVGALVALLPVGPVVAAFLWIDRWEPEPPRTLLLAFLWGACFAALTALLINGVAALVAEPVLGVGGSDVIGAVAVAPVVEEAAKGLFLVGLLVRRRREFDGIVDGVVYAGLVAAGFAFSENILYFGRAFVEDSMVGQTSGVVTIFVLRGVFSPFAHPLFTAMTGIGAGIASRARTTAGRVTAVAVGFALAVVLHALWNASGAIWGGDGFLLIYLGVMVPLFIAMIAVVVWQRRREQRVVIAELPGFARAGWIAPSEVPLLSSMAGRRGWRLAVRRLSGRKVEKAVAEYQAAITDLAFLRARMARGAVGQESGRFWHDEALDAVVKARASAVGHPEALTVAIRRHGPPNWTPPPPGPPPGGSQPAPGPYPYPAPGAPPQSWPPRRIP